MSVDSGHYKGVAHVAPNVKSSRHWVGQCDVIVCVTVIK